MTLTKGIVTEENFQKICKFCLEEKNFILALNSIIEFKDIDLSPISIADILSRVTSQGTNNSFEPLIICHDCLNELKIAYLFILKYEEAYKLLHAFVSNYVKKEEGESDCGNDNNSETEVHYETRNVSKRRANLKKRGRKKKTESNEAPIPDASKVLHSCPICTKDFTALELRDHAHTHKGLKKYLSIPPDKKVTPTTKFSTRRHLDNPNETIFKRPVKLHKCPYCNEEFPVNEFRVHIDIHRKQSEYKCDKCERVFKRLNHLNTHRVKHLKEYPYKCDQCGKGFVIKTNYECHILTHTNNELPHECRYCLKRFSNPEHLNRHQIIHTENVTYSVKYRVCKCHHCLKTFKDKDELKSHACVPVEQAVNTRFPCKTCKKVFKHSSGLYNHNRNIHKLKGAKTLCSVCGHYVSNIYNHMMRHTGEKPYQCNQCEKRFIAKPQLRQHLLVHSGVKPYVCSVCAKAFNNLYNLQVHERIHKGDRCHICPVCSKGFLEKSYLKKHMNVHSKV
ncbi:zinc finger protein 98 [Tribolium castaneum]|uniref:Zinc finger protein 227-like Protein n=1 Tax=Tribolium castaneum TaxID=7070 RepID=D6X3V0_TRICA|nr:PREDICTED: zinc finger protein 98 [Tribolium castaneum]EEZ97367.1 Zinc finger protein 227-like Protein [Tribolium castaneum]|eukprot:XP_008194500.1 PREDICTED: zinc finger protein 98 [Tribolium castaneum]